MRGRILAALAAVVLLGAGLFWAGRHERRSASASRHAARLPAFDGREVTALTIEGRGAACRVERSEGRWKIAAPVEDAASAAAIEAILVAARRTPVLQTVRPEGGGASFGLDPPASRLTLDGVDVPALSIGRTVPTGEGLYARLDGREDVLVLRLPDAAPLQTVVLEDLREPRWVDAQPSEITGLELPGIVLRREAAAWWIDAPHRLPASPARVDAFLASLAAARVVGWDDAGASDLGPGARRIVVRTGESSRTVILGAQDGDGHFHARAEGRSASLRVAVEAAHLDADVASLRERRLTNVNRYRVARLTYVSGAGRFSATRGGDGSWTAEGGAPLAGDRVLRLLVGLLETPTSAYEPGAPSGRADAAIDYATDDGGTGRVEVHAGIATWSGAPGVSFRLAAALPPVPGSEP